MGDDKMIAKPEVSPFNKAWNMTNASDFQLLTRKLHHLVTAGIIAGLLSGAILHAQEQSKSKPQLSKATLEILEGQVGQAILEAPEAQV